PAARRVAARPPARAGRRDRPARRARRRGPRAAPRDRAADQPAAVRLGGRRARSATAADRRRRLPVHRALALARGSRRPPELRAPRRRAARLAAPTRDPAAALAEVVAGILADLGARPTAAALSAEQSAAVGLAIAGQLAVVTGGPGTGKTLVAAAIVRGLA